LKADKSGIAADLNASSGLAAMTGASWQFREIALPSPPVSTDRTTDPDRNPLHCFSVVSAGNLNLFFCRRGLKL
jgi:hypothetical protein